ncbi:MAG: hypothetical protein ACP5SA_00160 [Candidatus Micrarchaeia archaeon]
MERDASLSIETEKVGSIVMSKIRQAAKSESLSFDSLTTNPIIEKWADIFMERIYGREPNRRYYVASVVLDEDMIYVHLKTDGLRGLGILFGLNSLLRGRHATSYGKLAEEISLALKHEYPNAKVIVDNKADSSFGD